MAEWKARFTYPKQMLDKPIIYQLIQQFGLVTNILEANVKADSGWLLVSVRGEPLAVQRGIEWVIVQGIEVEILSKE
jgi:ABC-type methionine transport system ATPase subunit